MNCMQNMLHQLQEPEDRSVYSLLQFGYWQNLTAASYYSEAYRQCRDFYSHFYYTSESTKRKKKQQTPQKKTQNLWEEDGKLENHPYPTESRKLGNKLYTHQKITGSIKKNTTCQNTRILELLGPRVQHF